MSVISKLEPMVLRSALSANGGVLSQSNNRWHYSGKLDQVSQFHRTPATEYPRARRIPLPHNLEDIFASEEARFSQQRSRDINGSLIAGTKASPFTDSHIASYDCTGSVSLSAHMQTNVPNPCKLDGVYTMYAHFNMPRGLLGQSVKYVAGEHIHKSTLHRLFSTKQQEEKTQPPLNTNPGDSQVEKKDKPEESGYSALSRREKLKTAVKEYGGVVIVFHVGISLMSLGVCYLAVTSGIDFGGLLGSWGPTEGADAAKVAAPFVVAYAVHKAFAPVRISVTLVSVPFIVKYLRRVGIMKPPKSKSH